MKQQINRLEAWLDQHYPELLDDLLPGADEPDLEGLEESLAIKLPEVYKTLLRWRNGQDGGAAGLFGNWVFLPIEDVLQEWKLWKDLADRGHFDESHELVQTDGPVKQRWWHAYWIPITADGMGNNHCLDLSPAPGGQSGQIITLWNDKETRAVLAGSLSTWLEQILSNLENGSYQLTLDPEADDYFFEPEGFLA